MACKVIWFSNYSCGKTANARYVAALEEAHPSTDLAHFAEGTTEYVLDVIFGLLADIFTSTIPLAVLSKLW